MTERTERLIDALRDELQHYGEMLNLLDQQQEDVVRRMSDQILNSVNAIENQSQVIRGARETREARQRELAEALRFPLETTLAELMELLPAKYRLLVQALVQENNELLFRVQQRAHQNHVLLSRSMDLMQRFINSLLPANSAPVYTGEGHLFAPAATGSSVYEAVG